jgi:glutathione synthase/RimK-type ligase-like ATP-grasp enzyme
VIAQRFEPSEFDWRIGVLDGRALFACRYHMARGGWQIAHTDQSGHRRYGKVQAVALGEAPTAAVALAERAAALFGDGFYGVDVKEREGRFLVIEVNDNPNVDSGFEDGVLGDELYRVVMQCFRARLDRRGGGGPAHDVPL